MRRKGKSYAHPLVVLIAKQNGLTKSQVAVSASRSVGNAVQRNKVKRKIRESVRTLIPFITPGWDIIILSRHKSSGASFLDIKNAIIQLLQRADLIIK